MEYHHTQEALMLDIGDPLIAAGLLALVVLSFLLMQIST